MFRAVFKWLSIVITWLRLLRLVIGLKESRQFFNQWESKLKPIIAPCTRDFSRVSRGLQVIARNCDWFMALFVPVVIGLSNCFGFGFSTVIWKPLYRAVWSSCDLPEWLFWYWLYDSRLKSARRKVKSIVNCSRSIEAPRVCSGCNKTICAIAYHALKYITSIKDWKKFDACKILINVAKRSVKFKPKILVWNIRVGDPRFDHWFCLVEYSWQHTLWPLLSIFLIITDVEVETKCEGMFGDSYWS